MENYNKVKECVEEYKCTLLTTFEEFENRRKTVLKNYYSYVRINFIGTCGHESSAVYTNFVLRKTGITCKDCIKINVKKVLHTKSQITTITESNGISLLEPYLTETYEIIRTKEGCIADLAIRKRNTTNNLYIPIQIKVTQNSCHTMYSFNSIKQSYKDFILICICIEDNKFWIIPYNHLNIKCKLNISKKSKYNKYLVSDNKDISNTIDKYLNEIKLYSLTELNTPTSIYQKREQEYVKKRESYIHFLNYLYPSVQNTATDFLINNKKIQEKVCGYLSKKHSLCVHLACNHGKKESGIRNWRTYRLGENDYYWFHSSTDDRFWIIPEVELFNRRYLSKSDETSYKQIFLINSNYEWLKGYEYNYLNVDMDKIKKIFD
jgi:hypothetical protein